MDKHPYRRKKNTGKAERRLGKLKQTEANPSLQPGSLLPRPALSLWLYRTNDEVEAPALRRPEERISNIGSA